MRKTFVLVILAIVLLVTVVAPGVQPVKANINTGPFVYKELMNGLIVWYPADPRCYEDGWLLVKYANTQEISKIKLVYTGSSYGMAGIYHTQVFPNTGLFVIIDGEINHLKIEKLPDVMYIQSLYVVNVPLIGKP